MWTDRAAWRGRRGGARQWGAGWGVRASLSSIPLSSRFLISPSLTREPVHMPMQMLCKSSQGSEIAKSCVYSIIVQFWTPSSVTQRRGERVQDHMSAHARAKPIVAHITSTCLFSREIQKLAGKLSQLFHAAGKNGVKRSYDAEKTC